MTCLGRVFLVVGYSFSLLQLYHAIPFWPAKFLLKNQLITFWERFEGRGEGATEDEMVGWHHQLNRHEFEQAPGHSVGQGSLACCSPWARKELDTT